MEQLGDDFSSLGFDIPGLEGLIYTAFEEEEESCTPQGGGVCLSGCKLGGLKANTK